VVEVSLEASWLDRLLGRGAWRPLPFHLSLDEEADIRACLELGHRVGGTFNGKSYFAGDNVRQHLEELMQPRLHFFYAEHLLGLWNEMNDRKDRARELYQQALEHAPIILVQRYEHEDGRPHAGALVHHLGIECNRVENNGLDPRLVLDFYNLTTDSDGCVRLPVYDTVYRLSSASIDIGGLEASYPTLGWFKAQTRVALLPPAKVARKR
jgi:hypothetical protein